MGRAKRIKRRSQKLLNYDKKVKDGQVLALTFASKQGKIGMSNYIGM